MRAVRKALITYKMLQPQIPGRLLNQPFIVHELVQELVEVLEH